MRHPYKKKPLLYEVVALSRAPLNKKRFSPYLPFRSNEKMELAPSPPKAEGLLWGHRAIPSPTLDKTVARFSVLGCQREVTVIEAAKSCQDYTFSL